MADSLPLRASRWLSRRVVPHRLELRGGTGVVSFTFDDAPMSACEAGAGVLERHGARGTFYIAGGLTDRQEEGRLCHSADALRTLLAAGHELGAHSYAHVRCDLLPAAQLQQELDRSDAFLAGFGVDLAELDFAYPFGGYALGAKRACGTRYRSSRITGGGTHVGWADLDALRCHRFYASQPDGVPYTSRLAEAAQQGGWLVVNTHEVENAPGAYGCTPAELDAAVAQALAAGCKVLPVGAARRYWQAQQQGQQQGPQAGQGAA